MIDRDQRLAAALAYATQGWPVHPCSPKNKRPLLAADLNPATGKKIPKTGGLKKASIDKAVIRRFWTEHPNALVGVCTGATRLFILDFDPRHDAETGEEWTLESMKAELEAQMGCALPKSLTSRTPSGGVHVWLRWPDDGGDGIRNRGNLPEHVDVRGAGGYVIAPPGEITGKGHYRWLHGAEPDFSAIAEAPPALVEILREGKGAAAPRAHSSPEGRGMADSNAAADASVRKYALAALDAAIRAIETAGSGGRNEVLNREAFGIAQLVAAGALSNGVKTELLAAGHRNPGRDDRAQVEATFASGWESGLTDPRDLAEIRVSAGRRRSAPPQGGSSKPFRSASAPDPDGNATAQGFHSGRHAPQGASGGAGGRIRAGVDPDLDRVCSTLPMTDLGNAERFRARFGGAFRFCPELGWFAWDERRWALLSEEKDKTPAEVLRAVFATVRAIKNEAKLVADSGCIDELHLSTEPPEPDAKCLDWVVEVKGSEKTPKYIRYSDKLSAHAKSSEGATRIGCIANLAKAFEDIAIEAGAMDRDRMAINVMNGTLRLVGGPGKPKLKLCDHDPADLISKVANVFYDPDAKSPVYDGFLAAVQPKDGMRRFLHQWGGLSLTGDISAQCLAFFHGKGRNGKSTLVDCWADVAGDYSGSVPIETFLDQGRARKGGEATPDLARLPGIRYLRTSEPEKGAKLAEALIKIATGGEEMSARFLNRGFFDFYPSFKLTISGNHKPKITGHDDGIWRRVKLVPWDVQIAEGDVDGDLPKKLKAEASGIFNQLLAGLLDWRENGLIEPDEVRAATAKYREQSDQLGRFLHQCTIDEPGAQSKSSELLALFNAWVLKTGGREWKPAGFSDAMEARGYEKKLSNGVKWLDLKMTMTLQQVDDGEFHVVDEPAKGGAPPEPDKDWGAIGDDDLP